MTSTRQEHVPLSFACEKYLGHMLGSVQGSKVLLVDRDMKTVLNAFTTHTGLLRYEVLLLDILDNLERPDLQYLPCVVIARPTAEVVLALTHELQRGAFKEFHLYFTNILDTDHFQAISNADEHSLVKTFEEVFFDMMPVTDDTCVVRLPPAAAAAGAATPVTKSNVPRIPVAMPHWSNSDFQRVCQGLVATMLACNRRPVIRYRNNSKVAARIASEIGAKMRMVNTTFFDLKYRGSLLLILERNDDPVTPLLTQWTYEAMMHEHFGIRDGMVNLAEEGAQKKSAKAAEEDGELHVLTSQHDQFFSSNRESDWGEFCTNVKSLIDAYKAVRAIDRDTSSLQDLRDFLSRFPELKTQSTAITRHASIMNKLAENINKHSLVDLSTIEQEIVNNWAPADHAKFVLDAMRQAKLTLAEQLAAAERAKAVAAGEAAARPDDDDNARPNFTFDLKSVIRLAILYKIRYDGSGKTSVDASIAEMRDCLINTRKASPQEMELMDKYIAFAASANRVCPLFPKSTGVLKTIVRAIGGFGNDVQNVLTQHQPVLKRLLCQCQNGTLPTDGFPFLDTTRGQATGATRFTDVIVFIAGGATYEEALLVSKINRGGVDNDPTTFPTSSDAVTPQHQRTTTTENTPDKQSGAVAALAATANMFNATRALASRAVGASNSETETGDGSAPSKKMELHVTLVSNGMIRADDLMASV